MAARRELPADFAAALDRFPAARDRFAALPVERQNEWLNWIDRARGRRRAQRIDEAVRRLSPRATAAEEEVAEPVGPPPDRWWWLWLLLLLLLVIAGLIIWLVLRGNGKTTVPNVVGMRAAAAGQTLRQHHLKEFALQGASSKPTGVVFAQSPGAARRVDKNSTVTISISSGPAHKGVPSVLGLKAPAAQAKITAAGFKAQLQQHASTRPKGIVFAQQPLAGVTAVKGATVILSVSTGVKPVTVPSVVGQSQGKAVTTLQGVGLKVSLKNVPSAQPVGQVVSQKPPGGSTADKGSTVLLNVSKGTGGGTTTVGTTATTATTATVTTSSAPVRIPVTRGLAMTAGVRRLNAAGLRPIVRYVPSSRRAETIVAQSPASGTAARGSRVIVSVSEGPNPGTPATVPNVIGQDQAAAASALRSAGFNVLVLFRKTTDQTKNGTVIDEQPSAGSSIPTGSYVAIFVGRFG